MRTDSLDVSSLVSYINDIKPFHSKLTTVVVEYQANDNVFVGITDKSNMAIHLSSVWELEAVSDGRRVQYRIPAAVFPRYADDFHQCDRKGVTDEVPGRPGAYFVPYNSGVTVYVNGLEKTKGFDYTIDDDRTVVQFIHNPPVLGDNVCLNWAKLDRVFISINGEWQYYDLEFPDGAVTYVDGYEMFPYDIGKFDNDANRAPVITGPQSEAYLGSIGKVRVLPDSTGKIYYVFEFYNALPLDTNIKIRVEQREAYNGWTQTKISESLFFADKVAFYDTVNAQIVDPGTWMTNEALYGIDISPPTQRTFDLDDFDTELFDSLTVVHSLFPRAYDQDAFDTSIYDTSVDGRIVGYYNTFTIHEWLQDSVTAGFGDALHRDIGIVTSDSIASSIGETFQNGIKYTPKDSVAAQIFDKDIGLYDEQLFDTVVFDSETLGMIKVTSKHTGPTNKAAASFTESLQFKIITDGVESNTGVYFPDENGLVVVNPGADEVQIVHNYGYLPLVSVYLNDQMMLPKEIVYSTENTLFVRFRQPLSVVIRLI
jgi:hypothetical protein